MKNLKDNIWIEGLNSGIEVSVCYDALGYENIIYHGKTTEIPEEIAKECVEIHQGLSYWEGADDLFYVDYNDKTNGFSKAKNSAQSACPQEYCIIFRK